MTVLEQTIQMISDSEDTNLFFRNDLDGIEACAIKVNDNRAIFVEEDCTRSSTRTNTILLHELSHLDCPKSLYDFDTSIYARKRRESKAMNYLIKEFISVETLSEMLKNGLPTYLIAEELMIDEEIIKKAINLYKENGLL